MEFHDSSPREGSHVLTLLWQDIVIGCKSNAILEHIFHVTRLLQRHVTIAMWEDCFQLITKVEQPFVTCIERYQPGVAVMSLFSHGRSVAKSFFICLLMCPYRRNGPIPLKNAVWAAFQKRDPRYKKQMLFKLHDTLLVSEEKWYFDQMTLLFLSRRCCKIDMTSAIWESC